jgi:hypothetical protein
MPKNPGTGHSVYLPTGDRRFRPPWSVEEQSACFVGSVKEHAVADHRSVIGDDLAS